jgi:repressor LexA
MDQAQDLSDKQKLVYDFLKEEIRSKGYPPAIREICLAVKLNSTSTVHAHLETLERKGYIRRSRSKNRCIEILEPDFYDTHSKYIPVPVLGKVTAGAPILAMENIEDSFPIPVDYVGSDTVFMLRVQGDSMTNAGIFHRDLILVRQQETANNGDIVVAMLEDSVTVKKYYSESNYIRLEPANDAFEPIFSRDVRVLGKVIGLYRRMK